MSDEKYELLNKINSPADLKHMRDDEILPLCTEIRDFLFEKVTETGGHLASNLGVVELSLAIHRVFDSPSDHIIWDVGHQSYVHKIITGRREMFDTLRHGGGLSGFTKRAESEHDPFGAGHSSTSVSAGVGFAKADMLAGRDNYTVVVVGDGAFTGGMVHEALNNCEKALKLIIILNENEMSISKNIGRFATSLAKIRTSKGYFRTKKATSRFLKRIPLVGNALFEFVKRIKQSFKNALYGSNYFENLGLFYIGPVDGNDYFKCEEVLREAKKLGESVVIHMKTKKGKGFPETESNPGKFHSVPSKNAAVPSENFSSRFGKILSDMADKDEKICAVTAAMSYGTGLETFRAAHPERFFDVGIAEEHALTFSAGLAANGMKPFFAVYSSFLQRGYDNLIHDIALQNLPVTVCVDRAGLSAADGATHHGIFDVAFLSHIPGMRIYTPATFASLERAMAASLAAGSPCAVRYNNAGEDAEIKEAFYKDEVPTLGARANFDKDGKIENIVITYGIIAKEALAAANELTSEGAPTGVILLEYLKPYGEIADMVEVLIPPTCKKIVFLEEGILAGGAGMLLYEKLRNRPSFGGVTYDILAVDDNFAVRKCDDDVWKCAGISAADVIKRLKNLP